MREERLVEDKRREASLTIQAALVSSHEMQELAQEAHDVANQLAAAHAEGHAQAANERNRLADAQAQQSLRIARTAGRVAYESVAEANSALARAKEAEQQAQQAVNNARANSWNLQLLKRKAQQALERATSTALAQRRAARIVRRLP